MYMNASGFVPLKPYLPNRQQLHLAVWGFSWPTPGLDNIDFVSHGRDFKFCSKGEHFEQ